MFFVENQVGVDNPHDETSPTLSSLIITSHVKEGLELAKQHKLPVEIRDIIAQHHGRSLVSYFYNKATTSGGEVDEGDFRYGGPRPKSREAALIMLADASEAAARTIQNPTVERMEQVVRRVAREKLDDGQLDESQLTLTDIDTIAKRYAKMLAGVYHKRVEYPDNNERISARTPAPVADVHGINDVQGTKEDA
jgi:membrane-associated HD superfamily phosphohydrolase